MEVDGVSMVSESAPVYEKPGTGVPFYDNAFSPAILKQAISGKSKPDAHFSTPLFPQIDFWVRAAGSGLEPLIPAGAAIGLLHIKSAVWQKWLPPGEVYVILTDDFALARVVQQSDDPKKLQLETLQASSGSKQQIPVDIILHIFKVVTICHEIH